MIVTVPVVVPGTVGVKTTVKVQYVCAATELPQLFVVMAKAAGLATMLPIATAELVLLVMVTLCG